MPNDLPGYSVRCSDVYQYEATRPYWMNAGTNVVLGKSPQWMSTFLNIPIVLNPNYTQGTTYPNIAVSDYPRELDPGVLAPLNVDSGTYLGTPWQWQCDVELYAGGALPPIPSLPFQQAVVYWSGNSSVNNVFQNIATPFPLDSGRVVVMATCAFFRGTCVKASHMPFTQLLGAGVSSGNNTIGPFTASGFSVCNNSGVLAWMNESGRNYCALVWRDPNPAGFGAHMGLTSYVGGGPHVAQIEVFPGSAAFGRNQLTLSDVGAMVLPSGPVIQTWNSPMSGSFNAAWPGTGAAVFATVNLSGSEQCISTGLGNNTHVWIIGRDAAYCSFDFAPAGLAGKSVSLINDHSANGNPISNMILSLGDPIKVGTDWSVNMNGQTYYVIAFNVNRGIYAANIFRSFGFASTAVNPERVTFPFFPSYSLAERVQNSGIVSTGGLFRSADSSMHGTVATTSVGFSDGGSSSTGVVGVG